jgi:two-component system, cell cycle sensor histidine kinase and response regulator CckA
MSEILPHIPSIRKKTNYIFILSSILWTTLVIGLFLLSHNEHYDNAILMAKSATIDSFQKDLVYRKWVALHGGVYVPTSDHAHPNPYLANIPDRDVETTSGKKLTLINPAYMTRQVHELGMKEYGLIGHITSLNPLRPENAPDEWERRALLDFQNGSKDVWSVEQMGDRKYFRYMSPMLVESSCIKCHGHQGYKEGDLRGGISVSVPWDSFEAPLKTHLKHVMAIYGLIWFVGVLGIFASQRLISGNISKQEITLDALCKSEDMLNTVLQATPLGIGLVKDRIISWTNDSLKEMTGYLTEELYGRSTRILYETDEEFQRVGAVIYPEISAKGQTEIETRFIRKDNTVIDVLLSLAAYDQADLSVGVVFTVMDVSERKKAAEQLQENAFRLERAELAAKFGNWELDLNTKKIKGSKGALTIYGVDKKEFELERAQQIPLPEFRPILDQALIDVIQSQKPYDLEFKAMRQSDKMIIDVHSIADFNPNTNVVWGVIQDITEKKQAQEELITMEKRLLHAQKLESLGVLSGGIAHDFNNLLTVIIGNLQLAMCDCDRISPAGRSLTKALEAANRSASLACQMLAYSGKGAFDVKDVNLSAIVADNAQMLRSAIAKTVNMEIELDDNMADVRCDAGQMQQLIMNLIINASEALEGKSGTVKLCTGVIDCDEALLAQSLLIEKPVPQDMAYIRVTDDGCGMSAETINRIFDPFFTSKFTGRGLGMSVVHGIVKGHGGAITVQSKLGKGTTIAVYFPVSHETGNGLQETLTQPSVNGSQTDRVSESKKLSFLVVDDEQQVRELMVEILNLLGHKTFSAVDGKEAMEIFNNNPDIDIVALDLTMPEMDGVETFQRMIQIKPDVKVILCSGYSPEEIKVRFTKGCIPAAFLKKPYGLSALKSAICQVIQSPNQRNQT